MGELITIQCGHYSNFIGTHAWNLKELSFEYDGASKEPREIINDVTFREGLTIMGEQTYTPRLIALDLPGSLKTLKEGGVLYQSKTTNKYDTVWQGGVDKHVSECSAKNEFLSNLEEVDAGKMDVENVDTQQYDLKSSVEVWSDFLRLHLHPNSLLMLPGLTHNDPDGGFDVFPAGLKVWESGKFRDSFEDKLHFFSEECDHLQGFHLLVDWDSGFGGLASCLAQELADEYSTKGLLSFAASPLTQPLDQLPTYRPTLLNHALTLDSLCQHSSMVCPLSQLENPWRTSQSHEVSWRQPPGLNYEPSLSYHSSCLFGTAIDTVSLLYRTEQSPASLSSVTGTLTQMGRKVCGMGLSLPFSLPSDSTLLSELDHTPLHTRLHPLTPFCNHKDTNRWSQAIAVRGIPKDYPLCPKEDPRYGDCHRHASHVLAQHLSDRFPSSTVNTNFCVVGKTLSIKSPYPSILPVEYHKNQTVPVCASFQSDYNIHQLLTTLTSELKATNVKRLPVFSTTCLDEDSCYELTHGLSRLGDCYRTGVDSDGGMTDSD